jgi:beta-1,4-mannosyltransferase
VSELSLDDAPEARPPLRVLQSINAPSGPTEYSSQLEFGKAAETTNVYFTWPRALFGRVDVFHAHWPEYWIRNRQPVKAALQKVLFPVLLVRFRLQGVAIVRTLHNLTPHEKGGRLEGVLLSLFDRWTTLSIRLNRATEVPAGRPYVTILHGHYVDRFADLPHPDAQPGRVLYFGHIRPYKGVDTLIDAFRATDGEELSLRIVGKPKGPELPALIAAAESADDRISSRLEFVDDDVMVAEVSRSALVVLPYREMHNSGALLVALSLGRPALVPRSPANEALAEETGPGWVLQYDGELNADILRGALDEVAGRDPAELPNLDGRGWDVMGERNYRAYLLARQLVQARRRRGRRGRGTA